MFLIYLLSALLLTVTSFANPIEKRAVDFAWNTETIRGVNIGGWLVLEPWITPSIFESLQGVVDEYTLGERLGREQALSILRRHWDTWITRADFVKIKGAGLNIVRIPIGFWAFKTFGTPYVQGAAPYLDAAIGWARELDLKVIIDLHGAPGSQNGFDNSGQRLSTPTWTQGDTVAQTLEVIEIIAQKYAQPSYQDVVVGIQLLNEPQGNTLNGDIIRQYYREGFNRVREVSDTTVILSDAFLPPSSFNGFLSPSDNNAHWVAIDHHEYQVFNNEQVNWEPWQHRQHVCNSAANYKGADKWTFIGEWSAAMTDCAKWLNGYGRGARYSNSYDDGYSRFKNGVEQVVTQRFGSCDDVNAIERWSETFRNDMRWYIEAQLESYERHTRGWVFWTAKTESSPEWDLFRLLDAGIFPQPLTDRRFQQICA